MMGKYIYLTNISKQTERHSCIENKQFNYVKHPHPITLERKYLIFGLDIVKHISQENAPKIFLFPRPSHTIWVGMHW